MIVFGGNASSELAAEVSSLLGCELGESTVKRFPDGELYVKIDTPVNGEDIVVIQSTAPPQNENLAELLFMMDALKDLGADITAVVPYYGYGRQDKAFKDGEAVTSRTIAKHIQMSASRVLTVNPHKEHVLDYFDVPAQSLDASPLIGGYFKKMDLDNPLVVAPDAGSIGLARQVAGIVGCECGNCEKKRLGPGKVITSAEKLNLDGDDVIIVDDIIDSGGTIVEAVKALKGKGAGSVYVACIHPVLTNNAHERILGVAEDLIATNTIKTPYSRISVAPVIFEGLKDL